MGKSIIVNNAVFSNSIPSAFLWQSGNRSGSTGALQPTYNNMVASREIADILDDVIVLSADDYEGVALEVCLWTANSGFIRRINAVEGTIVLRMSDYPTAKKITCEFGNKDSSNPLSLDDVSDFITEKGVKVTGCSKSIIP